MTTSISDTVGFRDACRSANLDTFKLDPRINQIFEHVDVPFGERYVAEIMEKYPVLATLAPMFQVNDELGGTVERVTLNGVKISPTTARYVKVAGDLLGEGIDHADSIVEIGAGYGGQCLILNRILESSPIYMIYDLPEVSLLQQRYLGYHGVKNTVWQAPEKVERWGFCISNFAFSECNREQQDWYLENVILKSDHGYMVCNFISHHFGVQSYSLQELGDQIPGARVVEDTPTTGFHAMQITW